MNVFYDGALVGPTEIAPPKKGGSGIEIIFKYYCSRRQQDAMNGHVHPSLLASSILGT